LLKYLQTLDGAHVSYNQKVRSVERDGEGWCVTVKDTQDGSQRALKTRFVFLGAGGGALPLLQMSGIPASKGFGGFPVSGQWLRRGYRLALAKHQAKVHRQAEVGPPLVCVPHLERLLVDGKKRWMIGPYASFSTRCPKNGSFRELPLSIRPSNIGPMLAV